MTETANLPAAPSSAIERDSSSILEFNEDEKKAKHMM